MQVETAQGIKTNGYKIARDIIKTKGFLRLWKGVSSVLIACIPSHAVYFSVYEQFKRFFTSHLPERHQSIAISMAGVGATFCHDAIMTPMDVIKQRLQMGEYKGKLIEAGNQYYKYIYIELLKKKEQLHYLEVIQQL